MLAAMLRRIAALAVVSLALAVSTATGARAEPEPPPATVAPAATATPAPAPKQLNIAPPGMTPENTALAQQVPVIDLLTMGVGSLIWERHGHIALCVLYGDERDRCYNYGIGDFHDPMAMSWGFLRATGAFWVDKAPPREMMWIYKQTDRTIWHQPLPLTQEEKQKVIAKLEHDIQPENSHYAYDHFWDNCTTRVRDVLDQATGGKLSAMHEPVDPDKTFRDMAREGFYGTEMPLGDRIPLLITDIAMGRATDRVPTYWERMFLPQYLREAVAKLWNVQPKELYTRKGPPQATEGHSGRWLLVLLILVATSPAWITRKLGVLQRTGLFIAIFPYFLLGAIETMISIVSPLPYLRWNETVLVWLAFDIVLPFLSPPARQRYARFRLVMLALLFVLDLIHIIKAPLLAPMLWPAIPMAVAGLWPAPPPKTRQGATGRSSQ
jgi:hypothetical protein